LGPLKLKLPSDFDCPMCHRKGGSVKLKIEYKKIAKDKQPTKPIWDSSNEKSREDIERTPHCHPYKWMNVLGVLDPNKKPVINPPKPKPTPIPKLRASPSYLAIRDLVKHFSLLRYMIPFVLQKYPSLEPIIRDMNSAATIMGGNLESVIDGRHRRSAAEWALIAKESLENSPNAASRKYPGITTEGKLEYLSPEYIKRKARKAAIYWIIHQHHVPIFLICGRIIANKINTDPQLAILYTMYEVIYDKKIREDEEEKEQRRQKQLEEQQNEEKSEKEFYKYKRDIFVMRHYDPEIRKQQKLERKLHSSNKKDDGKVEHKVKERDLPSNIVEELRRNRV